MRLLIDTHIALWAMSGISNLNTDVLAMLADGDNEVFVSVVTPWEVTIKHARGKMKLDGDKVISYVEASAFKLLPISAKHVQHVKRLPLLHQDPFDRILVAQAIAEDLLLLSSDRDIAAYANSELALGLRLKPVARPQMAQDL